MSSVDNRNNRVITVTMQIRDVLDMNSTTIEIGSLTDSEASGEKSCSDH